MEHSLSFARHFARLVQLILTDPAGSVDEQKAQLRAALTFAKQGAIRLVAVEWRLEADGAPVPEILSGVQDLTAQLGGHAVRELHLDAGAAPGDILAVARLLATEPVPGDGGRAFATRLAEANVATIHAVVESPEELAARRRTPASSAAIPAGREADAPATADAPAPADAPAIQSDDSGLFLAFSAVQAPQGTAGELIARLDAATAVPMIARYLDELATVAENGQRDGGFDVVAEIYHAIVVRADRSENPEVRRAYAMILRRMAKPTLLRAVAQLLPRRRERADELMLVLTRTGEDGADAVIELLNGAQSLGERRAYFDALQKLGAGVPALIHMLGDARWYVVRNAADLLGDMGAAEGEGALLQAIGHDDDRVRRSVCTALAKLGSARGIEALRRALRDSSPQVRLGAAVGLAALRGAKTATMLTTALDEEQDPEVQLAIISALGKLATPDAVQRLAKAAEPEGRLFKKKATAFRIAAVQALGEAKTSGALVALQALVNDKEKDVREAVLRAVMQAQQARTSQAIQAQAE